MSDGDMLPIAKWLRHERGFSVIPLDHPGDTTQTDPKRIGKVPVLPSWKVFQIAPATNDNLHAWFGNGRRRNIGIVTGGVSDLVAIDCDSPEAIAWADTHLPPTPMGTRTSKGEHRFYRHPGHPVRNAVRIRTDDATIAIDVRGDGGFVVAPGSLHQTGVTYERIGSWPQVAELPVFDSTWIESEKPDAPAGETRQVRRAHERTDRKDHEHLLRRGRAYLDATPPAIEGQGGDAHTFQVCCRLVRGFDLSDADALDLLRAWNDRCAPPWTEAELLEKIDGARKYGDEPIGGRLDEPQHVRSDAPSDQKHISAQTPAAEVGPTPDDRLTEAGAAERFTRLHGDDVRFDHRRSRWLLWEGHRWTPDADAALTRLALVFVRTWQREAIEIGDRDKREAVFRAAVRFERRDALQSMLNFAAALKPIADPGDLWDRDPWLLGVSNGTVDLRTGALRPGRRGDRITMTAGVEYHPEARSDLWQHALQTILLDRDVIEFFHTAIGYSSSGDTRRDCWFLGCGSGRNGKGTLYNSIRRALGDYALELPAAVFDLRTERSPYELAYLPGRRFVTASEAGDTIRLNHDRIKQLSGGDPVSAANKYEKAFAFEPSCKLWLSCNKKPRVADDSPAFWARVFMIPFPASFAGREDRDLRPTLEHDPQHQAAVLAWIVQGAVRYYTSGLEPPIGVRAATAEYQKDSDPLAVFLDEACEPEPGAEVGAKELYESYVGWADSQHFSIKERLSATGFGRLMSGRFEHAKDRKTGIKHYRGIARKGAL